LSSCLWNLGSKESDLRVAFFVPGIWFASFCSAIAGRSSRCRRLRKEPKDLQLFTALQPAAAARESSLVCSSRRAQRGRVKAWCPIRRAVNHQKIQTDAIFGCLSRRTAPDYARGRYLISFNIGSSLQPGSAFPAGRRRKKRTTMCFRVLHATVLISPEWPAVPVPS